MARKLKVQKRISLKIKIDHIINDMENTMEIFSQSNRKKNACFQLKRINSTNSRLLKAC